MATQKTPTLDGSDKIRTADLGSGTASATTVLHGNQAYSKVGVGTLNATGTASGTTYLRGDGTWSTPSGGALVAKATSVTVAAGATVTVLDLALPSANTYQATFVLNGQKFDSTSPEVKVSLVTGGGASLVEFDIVEGASTGDGDGFKAIGAFNTSQNRPEVLTGHVVTAGADTLRLEVKLAGGAGGSTTIPLATVVAHLIA